MSKQSLTPDSSMEQIRQLLFGQQMEELNRKFTVLQQELADFKKESGRTAKDIQQSIEALKTAQQSGDADVLERIAAAETHFQQQMIELEQRIGKMVEALDNSAIKRTMLADYLSELGERLRQGHPVSMRNGQPESGNE